MTEKIRSALETCAEDSGAGLRSLLQDDPDGFLRSSVVVLEGDSPGREQLLRLLADSDQVAPRLCDPDFLDVRESVELARRIAGADPRLETKLVRMMPRPDSAADHATIERVLTLLEAASSSARIVPALAHLLHDTNPRLRAKATLLIGRRAGNSQFVEGRMQETDPRVRANAIEALFDGKGASSSALLWHAVKDQNNRVAGNALLALYQIQERGAIPCIFAMSADARPPFRATAAWVMARTGDPRFLPTLERLERDLYALVRKNAVKAIEHIHDSTRTGVRFELNVLRVEKVDGVQSLSMQALLPDGDAARGLLPSQFILWRGEKLVTEYEVVEHDATGLLGVGFALCGEGAEQAVASCLARKPAGHLWHIGKFSAGANKAAAAAYAADPKTLETALAGPPLETCPFRSLLPGLSKIEGDRHLILFAGADFAPPADTLVEAAIENGVAIHLVMQGAPGGGLMDICARTGGVASTIDGLAKLYSGLSNCYRIRSEEAISRIQVYSPAGQGECAAECAA